MRWLPQSPGKAVQLEIKTTVPSGRHQDVFVDLGQLWDYMNRSLGRRPFYVFPRPDWRGTLEQSSSRNGKAVTELAFARSGADWWFADWMIVLTCDQVAAVLSAELAGHGKSARGTKARLVRFEVARTGRRPSEGWGLAHLPSQNYFAWRSFWDALESCGQPGWPQFIRVPRPNEIRSRPTYGRTEVLDMLVRSIERGRAEDREMVTLEAFEDGRYILADEQTASIDDENDVEEVEDGGHRRLVFLHATALRLGG